MHVRLFHEYGWGQVALLTESFSEFLEYQSQLQDELSQSGVSIVHKMNLPTFYHFTEPEQKDVQKVHL